MSSIVDMAVPLLVAVAVLIGGGVLATTRDVSAALPVLLDLLLVAGLLRLGATSTWQTIGSAAVVVLIRRIVSFGIATSHRSLDHTDGRRSVNRPRAR